jgi:hypothetical protein
MLIYGVSVGHRTGDDPLEEIKQLRLKSRNALGALDELKQASIKGIGVPVTHFPFPARHFASRRAARLFINSLYSGLVIAFSSTMFRI